MIAGAEKFQADIAQPQGMFHAGDGPKHTEIDNRYFIGVKGQEGQVIDDDEFFHVTCHINSNTAQKIEWGKFIDLDKLLMHDRIKKSNYDRLEFIMKEGQTYLAPAGGDREPKVNGIWRWEQAFRVYAAIYSKANPHRAA